MQKTFLLACFLVLISCTSSEIKETRVMYLNCSNVESHKNITLVELRYSGDKLLTWKEGVMDSKLETFWDPLSSNPIVGKAVGDDFRSTIQFAQRATAECVEFTSDRSDPFPLALNLKSLVLHQSFTCSSDQIVAAQCSTVGKSAYAKSEKSLIERFETQQ